MQADNGLADFKAHPNLVKAWCRAGRKWMDSHPESKTRKKYGDVYRNFVRNKFFNSYQAFMDATSGMFGKVDCKKFLEDYFHIKF